MGNPKQKWTSEEEEALKAGVQKHGTGKWKDIQKDPEFNPFLSSRSNIDLKDKWRNMTVSGNNPREKSRVPRARVNLDAPVPAPAPALAPSVSVPQTSTPAPIRRDPPPAATPIRRDPPPAAAPVRRDAAEAPPADDSSTGLSDAKTGTMYNAMIFEALSTDPNGLDTSAIASFIEQRNEVPPNFRRSLTNRLRRMIHQDKLEKVQNCYKVKTDSPKEMIQPRQSQSPGIVTPGDTQEETAYMIAEAQNKLYSAIDAVRESERIAQMAEDQEDMLQLAKDIFDQCSDGEVVLMV